MSKASATKLCMWKRCKREPVTVHRQFGLQVKLCNGHAKQVEEAVVHMFERNLNRQSFLKAGG